MSIPSALRKSLWTAYLWAMALPVECFASADDQDIWKISPSDSFSYDDNLFRFSKNRELKGTLSRSDFINRASVDGLMNFDFSRQRLSLSLKFDDNRYLSNSFLSHQSTDDKFSWNWQVGKFFSGDVGHRFRRYMGGFTNTNFFDKDLIDEHLTFFDGIVAVDPRWRMLGGVRWLDVTHGARERNFLDVQSISGSIGFDYTSASKNVTGFEYRFTQADLPNRELSQSILIDNHYEEQTVFGTIKWRLLEKVFVDGRLGYADRQYRNFSARSYSGELWRMNLNWELTPKTMISLSGWHELLSAQDLTASYIVAEGVGVSPAWSITPKVTLFGRIAHETRDYTGDPGLVIDGLVRHDEIISGLVSVKYTPFQNSEFSFSYQAEERTSNRRFSDYIFNSVTGSVVLKF